MAVRVRGYSFFPTGHGAAGDRSWWRAIRVKSTWPRDFNASRRAWSYHRRMARIVWQLVGVLLLIGFVGAYFWPIALTLAAAYLSYRLVLHGLGGEERA